MNPRRMNKKAKVTMKLGRPVLMQIRPFNAPIVMQITKVNMIAIHMGQPNVTPKIAMSMPAKPIIEPTLRSNSPAIISRHAPTAMIINWAETTDQFITPCTLNMPLSPAKKIKTANTATVPMIPPSSGRISALRNDDISLTRSSVPVAVSLDISFFL